jgi:hypothetical protein
MDSIKWRLLILRKLLVKFFGGLALMEAPGTYSNKEKKFLKFQIDDDGDAWYFKVFCEISVLPTPP